MIIPSYVSTVLNNLKSSGFEAYAVGGCVRDMLMGKTPSDWDITTSARPFDTEKVFGGYKTIRTGMKHGTITVLIEGHHVEITTYRIDGKYSDNRRPDAVTFTPNLAEDLARRDFTVNAMAYSPDSGIVDLFDGQEDLKNKIIKCVGNAEKRFTEDALRIMRALRFAAVCGFDIEPQTARALGACRHLLRDISSERIASELNKLLLAPNPATVLREYSHVISQILPEITPSIGFDQQNHHHCFDVWEHTLCALENSAPKLPVRLALLFHDLAKPLCATRGMDGQLHFPRHPILGAELASDALRRLKYDNKTRHAVKLLVELHDSTISASKAYIKRMLKAMGQENFAMLLEVKKADNLAKSPEYRRRYDGALRLEQLYNEIIDKNECYCLDMLDVNGSDLMEISDISGTQIGNALDYLLDMVIEGKCENEKKALLRAFKDNF